MHDWLSRVRLYASIDLAKLAKPGDAAKIRGFCGKERNRAVKLYLADALAKAVRIVALGKGRTGHSNPNLARYEMAIPWSALGVTPKAGLELPFNAFSFMSEYKVMKCWDGLDADPTLVLR